MLLRAWTCGLMAALIGCNTLDRGFEPPRGFTPQTGQVPPGAPATWQQGSMVGTYRVPPGPYSGALPGAYGAAQFPSSPAGFPAAGAAAGAVPPGTPTLDLGLPSFEASRERSRKFLHFVPGRPADSYPDDPDYPGSAETVKLCRTVPA